MKILRTGATGYIAQRLLPVLLEQGHSVVCLVRSVSWFDKNRFSHDSNLTVVEADLMNAKSLESLPKDIDAAYYLVHSMSGNRDFSDSEAQSARNFSKAIGETAAKQIIFLSGIINSSELSRHLASHKKVEQLLGEGRTKIATPNI